MMSKTLLAAVGLIAAGLAASSSAMAQIQAPLPIPPEPVTERYFELFDRACISTGGEVQPVLAVADAEGWPEAPPELIGEPSPGRATYGRLAPPLSVVGEPVIVMVGSTSTGDIISDMCAVFPMGAALNEEVLVASVAKRLGLEARTRQGGPVWTYSGKGPFVDEGALFGTSAILDVARDRPIYTVTFLDMNEQRALVVMNLRD